MSKEQVLGQVTSTRRRFLQRLVTGVALAIPASAILKAQQEPEGKGKGKKGKGKKGEGKGEGKGKGNE